MNSGQPATELDELVNTRLERQAILTREIDPPQAWFVLDESALHRPVGGNQVMREQLAYLAKATELPNVHVRILPYASITPAGLDGSFTVMNLPDGSQVLYHEGPGVSQMISDPATVSASALSFDLVMGEALPRRESLAMIMKALEDYA